MTPRRLSVRFVNVFDEAESCILTAESVGTFSTLSVTAIGGHSPVAVTVGDSATPGRFSNRALGVAGSNRAKRYGALTASRMRCDPALVNHSAKG